MSMNIVISGGRDYYPSESNYTTLMAILKTLAEDNGSIQIRIGDCPTGVDREVSKWVKKNIKETIEVEGNEIPLFSKHPLDRNPDVYIAEWSKYGKKAGPMRNRQMLSYRWGYYYKTRSDVKHTWSEPQADRLIAFPGGKGTQSAIDIADELQIPVIRISQYD